jgi:uncharacterized membrane protein YhaH (DUF805 family)
LWSGLARGLAPVRKARDDSAMFASLIEPLRRTLDFSGRARRSAYWGFILWQLGFLAAAFNLLSLLPDGPMRESLVLGVLGLWLLVFALPTLALQVRRVHDHDTPGWMLLVMFLPYLGAGWMLWLMLAGGTPGPNRYGADPRAIAFDAALFE